MRNSPLRGMASLLAVAATAVVLTGCCVSVQIGGRHTPFYGPEYRHREFARIHDGRECPIFERDRFCPRWRDGRECPIWQEREERRACRERDKRPMLRDGRERPMMHERPECCPDGKAAPARAGDGCRCVAGDKKCGPDCQMYKKQPGPMNRDDKPAPPAPHVPPTPPAPPAK